MIKRIDVCAGLAGLALALSLNAAEPAAQASAAQAATQLPDPEEQLDDGFKRFGYLAGLARGCVTDTQRPVLEKEALDLNAGIARLFGTDRAFLFSAAFGFGTSLSLELKECEEVLAAYDERVANFRAKASGAKQ